MDVHASHSNTNTTTATRHPTNTNTPEHVWHIQRRPYVFRAHHSFISHLDFSRDGKFLQSNCGGYELLFCDTATGTQVRSAKALRDVPWLSWTCPLGWPVQGIWPEYADGSDINAVCASHAQTFIATGDDHATVKVFRYPCVAKGVRRWLSL